MAEDDNKEMNILKYLCDGFSVGPEINNKITISYVFKVINLRRRALAECHKLKGLLRFQEIGDNLCYASIHPDNNILEPLGHHFIKRLPSMSFIIHDKNRNLCFIYNNKDYRIISSENIKLPSTTSSEIAYQELWKLFLKQLLFVKEQIQDVKCNLCLKNIGKI